MTYQIVKIEKKRFTVWGEFTYPPSDQKEADRIISFIEYIKSAPTSSDFILREVETDHFFNLVSVSDRIKERLKP